MDLFHAWLVVSVLFFLLLVAAFEEVNRDDGDDG